jgi:hypothetical protein
MKKGEKKLTTPLTLPSPTAGRGEIKRVKRIPLKTSSPLTGEDKGGGGKINITPHPNPLPQGERGIREN